MRRGSSGMFAPRRAFAGLTLLLAAGCAGPLERPPPAAPPAPPAAPVRPAPAKAESSADLVVNRVLQEVAELRQLPPTAPVNGRVIGRKEMIDLVALELKSELPSYVISASEAFLVLLGVVPVDFQYEKSLLALMTSQLAGFYQPDDKTMYLAADLGPAESDATLSHELVHALQDQHYDLGPRIKYRDDASDEQAAIHALAEGDATSAMIDQQLKSRGVRAVDLSDRMIDVETRAMIELSTDTVAVPRIVKRSVISPYVDGILFVHWARRQGGWARVDEIWRRPPITTEQLLHPDKYVKNEVAEVLPIPAPPAGSALTVAYHDVLGEQALRLVLEEWLPRRTAELSASDWAGDRLAVFASGDRHAAAWRLRFDVPAAATRAAEALARGFATKTREVGSTLSAKQAAELGAGRFCFEREALGAVAIRRHDRDVVITLGPIVRHAGSARTAGDCGPARAWAAALLPTR